ncbi:unnamed protein product [Soboliphyme baturini]|uniref:ZP domain-containing protein n=1 Tax=Soboliphyme baturini TaxID=241478 RepID=A0A183J5I3_9BILA|nr:unnamed protein product [Soboliphyme baturini]
MLSTFLPGAHYIDVRVYEQSIDGSPFTCNVGDPDLVTVRGLQRYIRHLDLGTPVSFTSTFRRCMLINPPSFIVFVFTLVDASAAGSGTLEILINDGKVNCRVRELGSKTYLATYTPLRPIGYTIEMMFNKSPVKGKRALVSGGRLVLSCPVSRLSAELFSTPVKF